MLQTVLSSPWFLGTWVISSLLAVAIVSYDLMTHNRGLGSLMKWVWVFTVLYSSFLGLIIYCYSGRSQIARDSLWRKGFRSVSHCYSGCGAGEIAGVLIAAGLLSLGNWWVAGVTFVLAYVFGFGMTIGPLMQSGESLHEAFVDAFWSESASITVMEVVAIGVDLWLAGSATIGDVLFWSSLIVSLTLGLLAAYPVNLMLIHWGFKEGMHNPKHMAEHSGAH